MFDLVTSEFGRVLLTYNAKINNLGSSDIQFEFPLSALFPNFGFGNMVIQAARRTTDYGLETNTSAQEAVTPIQRVKSVPNGIFDHGAVIACSHQRPTNHIRLDETNPASRRTTRDFLWCALTAGANIRRITPSRFGLETA